MFYIFFKFFICVLSFYIRSLKQTEMVTFSTLRIKQYLFHYFLFLYMSPNLVGLMYQQLQYQHINSSCFLYYECSASYLNIHVTSHKYYGAHLSSTHPYISQSKNINLGHLNSKALIYRVTKHLLGMIQVNAQKLLMI